MTTDQQKQSTLKIEYALAASVIGFAGLLGMVAWLNQGDTILWSVIEAGLVSLSPARNILLNDCANSRGENYPCNP